MLFADTIRLRVGNARDIQYSRQQVEVVIERRCFQRLRIQFRIMHDQRYVDHFLIRRVGLLTHAVRQAALAMVGNPQDDRVV